MRFFTLLFALSFFTYAAFSQAEFSEHAEECLIKAPVSNEVIIDNNRDSVASFLCRWLDISPDSARLDKLQLVFSNFQTFTTRETYDAFKKERKEFYNVYEHGHKVPAKWEIRIIPVGEAQTKVVFSLLSFFADRDQAAYKHAVYYKAHLRDIVSNGNLEGLFKLAASMTFAPAPIVAASFSRSSGFDDGRYKYDHFIPDTALKGGSYTLFKPVPRNPDSLVKHNELLVYTQYSGKLYAFDMEHLKLRWTKQLPFIDGEQDNNSFTVKDHIIYQPTNKGTLSAIDAESGYVYWQTSTGDYDNKSVAYFRQSAPVSQDMVYVNDNKHIYALDRYTGKLAWSQQHGGYGHYNYSFSDQYVYKSGILELFELDKYTGEVHRIINSTQQNTFYFPNLLLGKRLICCEGKMYCYDLEKDTIVYSGDAYDFVAADTLQHNLYLGGDNGTIRSLDIRSGAEQWRTAVTGAPYYVEYLVKGHQLFALSQIIAEDRKKDYYKVSIIDLNNGRAIKDLILPFPPVSNMTISGNQLLLLTAQGITCIDTDKCTFQEKKYDFGFLAPADIAIGNRNYISVDKH